MEKANDLRKMISEFVLNDSSKISYQLKLAKYSELERIDIRLNTLENMEIPDDEEEMKILEDEIEELYEKVCKIINQK